MSLNFGFSLPALAAYGGGGDNPFGQLGPTLDLSFANTVTDVSSPTSYTLDTNFITPQYQIATQYAIWETNTGLVAKNFSDIVTFTRASTATYFNSAGVLTSAAINAPRFDYNPSTLAAQGLLIEEARTNSIRNNTMQGAVAGTPGTAPTNWVMTGTNFGITQEIVGTGTQNGITYIDVKISGTSTASSTHITAFEATNQIAAASGQTWATSSFLRVVAGSTSGLTIGILTQARNAGNTAFTETFTTNASPTATLTRFTAISTLADVNTAFVRAAISMAYNNGAAIDITLRIGLPQLEQGAFATSVIPTTTTALTRSADVASVNTLNPWFNATEGTIYVEASPQSSNTATLNLIDFNNATANNRIALSKVITSSNASFFVNNGNIPQANISSAVWTATGKLAGAYKLDDFATSYNGASPATDTAGTVPLVTQMQIGVRADGSNQLTGYIRRITYYPRRLSNAELQTITT